MDERNEIAGITALGADYSRRHGIFKTKWRTDREYPFANANFIGVADVHLRQARRIDLQYGDIGALIGANYLGLELALVGQGDVDFICICDDMGIGNHIAVGRNNETGTLPQVAQRRFLIRILLAWIAARCIRRIGIAARIRNGIGRHEAAEKFVKIVFVVLLLPFPPGSPRLGADVDHGRSVFFNQLRKIRQLLGKRCGVHKKHCRHKNE